MIWAGGTQRCAGGVISSDPPDAPTPPPLPSPPSARPPQQQGEQAASKHRSPLTWIVQVYSESSSSLTVQLHSRSRLLTLLLISRLSIFPDAPVCGPRRGEREEREREAPCTHARTHNFDVGSHVNDLCVLGSNTRSETGWPAAVRSGRASSLTGRLASFLERGGNNAATAAPSPSLSLSLSPPSLSSG